MNLPKDRLEIFDTLYHDFDYDKVITYQISDIKNDALVGQPIKVLATISSKSEPLPTLKLRENPYDGEPSMLVHDTFINLTLKDHNGDEISCIPMLIEKYTAKFEQAFKMKGYFLFYGTVDITTFSPGKPNDMIFNFYLTDISRFVTPLDILKLKIHRREHIGELFKSLVNEPGGIRNYIKNSLIENLHIEGLQNLDHLDKAIDFNILQSFSFGMSDDGNYSNKLHSLVIGPPASGKKFLIAIAKILNPIAFEVSSTAGKCTPAGLIGSSRRVQGRTTSEPGYFPRASGGIVCIQDFHQIKDNRDEILSIFTKVMEDGAVIDSTSAMAEHLAVTALHVDTNLYSQVKPIKHYAVFSDLNISMEVLSRFDFIIDIIAVQNNLEPQ